MMVGRGAKKKGARYFGPYSHAWAIRETVDLLLRVFPMRSCSNGVFKRSAQIGRPCLLGYIDKCSAPCVGSVTADEHREIVDDFCDFMAGQTDTFVGASSARCTPPPTEQDYETRRPAARRPRRAEQGAGEAGGRPRRRHRRRRDRARRGPARGRGADLPRARRPGPRPARLGRGPGRGHRPGRLVEQFLLQLYAGEDGRRGPARGAGARRCPTTPTRRALAQRARGSRVSRPGAAARRQAGPEETVAAQRAAVAGAAQDQARQRPHHPQPGAGGDPEGPRPARGAAADRVLRRLQPAGHRGRRLDGGLRGRAGPQDRLPPVRRSAASTGRTTSRRCTRSSPAGSGGCSTSGPSCRSCAPASEVDADQAPLLVDPDTGRPRKFAYAPGLVVVDGGPPRSRRRSGRSTSSASTTSRVRARQAARGGLAARRGGPGDPAAHQRGRCTCCSGSATRRTDSRSPTTGTRRRRRMVESAARRRARARARCGARRCSRTSAR